MNAGRTLQCILLSGLTAAACAPPESDLTGRAAAEPESAAATPAGAAATPAVELPGAPRDSLVSLVIPPAGGTLELPSVMTLHFPAGAFTADTRVTVYTTSDEDDFDHFINTTSGGSPPAWIVVVEVTGACPGVPATAEFVVPVDYRTAVDTLGVRAFAAQLYSSETELHDTFEALETAPVEGIVLRAELAHWVFSEERSSSVPCEALLAIARERVWS